MENLPFKNPPRYPIIYYECRYYVGMPPLPRTFEPLDGSGTTILSPHPRWPGRLLADFDRTSFDRCGVVKGEYALSPDGMTLIDRQGNCISINAPQPAAPIAGLPYQQINTTDFRNYIESVLAKWDELLRVERSTVWSHYYHDNYFHFAFELLQKARLTETFAPETILMPGPLLAHPFQRFLFSRALGTRKVVPLTGTCRVVDPIVAEGWLSRDAVAWFRGLVKVRLQPGRRRLLIRRAASSSRSGSRPGNNIALTPEIVDLLERHNFETVDFGTGGLTTEEQAALLDGAGVILAPHGAGMTNMAFLNPPVTIIEAFNTGVLSANFMQIAMILGLRYYAIISEMFDAEGSINLDPVMLETIFAETAS